MMVLNGKVTFRLEFDKERVCDFCNKLAMTIFVPVGLERFVNNTARRKHLCLACWIWLTDGQFLHEFPDRYHTLGLAETIAVIRITNLMREDDK